MQQFILLAPLPLLRLPLAARSHALQRTPCCGDASEGCWGSAVTIRQGRILSIHTKEGEDSNRDARFVSRS